LDSSTATSQLQNLHDLSKRFYTLSLQAMEILDLFKCIEDDKENYNYGFFDWLVPLSAAIDVLLVLMYLLFRSKKHKLKVN